jgi:hypothetical protein
MKTKPTKIPTKIPTKRGPDKGEPAVKAIPHDPNFKQSKDIHEDRGRRQIKTTTPGHTRQGR